MHFESRWNYPSGKVLTLTFPHEQQRQREKEITFSDEQNPTKILLDCVTIMMHWGIDWACVINRFTLKCGKPTLPQSHTWQPLGVCIRETSPEKSCCGSRNSVRGWLHAPRVGAINSDISHKEVFISQDGAGGNTSSIMQSCWSSSSLTGRIVDGRRVRWLQQGLYRRNLNPEMAFIQTSKMPITIISKTLLIPISTSLNLLRHEGLVRYVMKQKVVSPFLNVGLYKKPLLLFLRRLAGCRQDWAAEGGLAVKRWAGYPVCCYIFTHMIDAVGATKRAAPRFLLLFFKSRD